MQLQSKQVDSHSHASALLGALGSGDNRLVERELSLIQKVGNLHDDAFESERFELLSEIAAKLASTPEQRDVDMCVGLLTHLTCSPSKPSKRRLMLSVASCQ